MSSHTCDCGCALNPENNVAFATLDFGDNTAETNHNVTCNDLVDLCMDSKFPCYVCCGKIEIDLDLHEKFQPVCKECLKSKVKVEVGKRNTTNNDKTDEAIIKAQKKKRQQIADFP